MVYLPDFENPIGYLIGLRQWQCEGLLLSVVVDYYWKPWQIAEGDLDEMYKDERRGINAAKEEHEELLNYNQGDSTITGKVALWGKVIEHEKGYRAQYAYPIEFVHCTNRHIDMDELREIYLQPSTPTAQIIVREREKWISEKRKEREKSGQLAFQRQTLMQPPLQALGAVAQQRALASRSQLLFGNLFGS